MTDPSGQTYVAAFGLALKGIEAIKSVVTTEDAKKRASELYEVIIAGQASALEESLKQRALLEQIEGLKNRVATYDTWNLEKSRYALAPAWPGCVIRALKRVRSEDEPAHWICPDCYDDRKKSFLQDSMTVPKGSYERVTLYCKRCDNHLISEASGGQIQRLYAEEMK